MSTFEVGAGWAGVPCLAKGTIEVSLMWWTGPGRVYTRAFMMQGLQGYIYVITPLRRIAESAPPDAEKHLIEIRLLSLHIPPHRYINISSPRTRVHSIAPLLGAWDDKALLILP